MTWDKINDQVFAFLDKINLEPYIEMAKANDWVVEDMMDILEEEYPYKNKYVSSLFDSITQDEFMNYLTKRYRIHFREIVTYRF